MDPSLSYLNISSGLTNGQTYLIEIKAANAYGESANNVSTSIKVADVPN